jgi:uncharacterized protein (TIGR02001 family)
VGDFLRFLYQKEKKMKKMVNAGIVFCLLSLILSVPAFAAIEVEGDVYAGFYDKYMWRGLNLSASQPVMQGGVDLSAGGFTLSFWSNVQLSNGNSPESSPGADDAVTNLDGDEVTETDITLDYTREFGPVSVSVGDIYYNFNVPGNTHELYLGISADVLLSPSFTVYYDWDYANDIDVDGLYYSFGVSHSFDLMEKLSLGLGAAANYSDESPYLLDGNDEVYSEWHNYELSSSLDYAINDQLSVSASFVFSEGLSDESRETLDSEMASGVSVTFSF